MAEGGEWKRDISHKINDLLEAFQLRERELDKRAQELEIKQAAFEEEMTKQREEVEKELAAKRLQLEEDILKSEVESKRMDEVYKFQSSRVKLDVGGQSFTTSLQTLKLDSESMLAVMFSGRHKLVQEGDESYFIDRDGTHFRHILNYLRDGFNPELLPQDERSLKEIEKEAHFYQLTGLVSAIASLLDPPPPAPDLTQQQIDDMLATITRQSPHSLPLGMGGNATFVCRNMTKTNIDFAGKNLSGLSFAHTTFAHNVSFIGACLINTCFYGCEFVSHVVVDFSSADVSGADFRQCRCIQGGPNAFGGQGVFQFGAAGSGFMYGSSCSSFAHLIKSGHLKFTGAKHIGTKFDPNIFEVIRF